MITEPQQHAVVLYRRTQAKRHASRGLTICISAEISGAGNQILCQQEFSQLTHGMLMVITKEKGLTSSAQYVNMPICRVYFAFHYHG